MNGVAPGIRPDKLDAHQRALVAQALPKVRRLAGVFARRYPRHEAEELVQMASESASRAVIDFRPEMGASFVTFAWRRALGALLDHLERDRLRRTAVRAMYLAVGHVVEALDDLGDPFKESDAQRFARLDDLRFATRAAVAFGLLSPVATPEDAYLEAEERARLERCLRATLDATDPGHRALVMRHFVDGESVVAIAQSLDEPYAAVQKRIVRALAKMGRAMRASTAETASPPYGRARLKKTAPTMSDPGCSNR